MAIETLLYGISFRLVPCLLYTQQDTQGYEWNSVTGSLMLSELSSVKSITVDDHTIKCQKDIVNNGV